MAVGVLLAAGRGTRFAGGNPLLAPVEGRPVVAATADALAALPEIVAVVGHDADRVQAALADHDLGVVENPDYEEGQATSVRRGVEAARERDADAVVFVLGDLPGLTAETVERVVAAGTDADAGIAVAVHDGTRGHPVYVERRHFDALAGVEGDAGARRLFAENPVERVSVPDPGVRRDVDTRADLARIRGHESDE